MFKENLKRYIILVSKILILSLTITVSYADISGTVYKDFNFNGSNDGGDAPVIGASLKATCDDGNMYTATTDTNGAYTLSGFPAGSKCRIEADVSASGVGSGPNASGAASPLVDVVTDGSVHNISTGSSATYCQSNPDVVMAALPGYYTQEKWGAGGGIASDAAFGTVFKVPAPQNGVFNNNVTISANRVTLATFGQTGAIWGAAWQKGTKTLFVSAGLKRFVSLKDESSVAAVQASAGTIYKINTINNTVVSFSILQNVLTPAAATDFSNRDYSYNKDSNILKYVARQGLGDLEISEDETKLYTVNMNTKELVVIDATNGNVLQTVAIPNPYGAACTDDKVRPWALKVRGTDVFIGSVCEDQITNDVGASIQKYNGAIIQTIAQTNSLTYLRARSYKSADQSLGDGYRYQNWSSSYGTDAPILTDIEFTNNGDLVLGYNSRGTYNRVGQLGGDIRKMCLNTNGTFTDETTDVVTTTCSSHVYNFENNPTDYYGFYIGDFFGNDHGGYGHPETASGALAQAPGAANIIVGMIDATDWYQAGAIGNYDNITGDKLGAQAVINRNTIATGGEREPYGGKAGGMGDVELLCDPAPIEVGNLVWVDGNQDGIQDPNEPGIPNVTVTLTCGSTVIGSVATDVTGHYYFGGINNTNLIGGNTITAGQNCTLSLAQADVNNKPPTITNPNADANDTIDNDAVASRADNVINFTTTVSNDHSLDFGITPTIGCVEGLLYDDANNNGSHEALEQVASNVNLKITDSFGGVHIISTDNIGNYQLTGIPAGPARMEVDTTDTDIPEGSIWYNATFNINIPESTPGGVPAACLVQDARLHIPAPTDQDPKDVAVCANPTSITWEGATVSSASVWHDMASSSTLGTAKTFTTVGGATVDATMYITNPDEEFNNATAGTYDGAATLGTDGAFNDPYLTLYLGDQSTPGNGTWNDESNCASNGYDLTAGEKIELVVEFSDEVVLDNWRIRDVDSGDDRGGIADWNWQDGIKVEAFDANNNPVTIETKIGSAGSGLIKDANDIVHTDSATYNGGDVAHGVGTTPNSSNGHIVLTSNFVPIKKIVVTHLAAPDVPCQTRSALAMAGFAVCKPLHISGTVYNDENGVKPTSACDTSDNTVNGTPISDINGTALNACLLDNTDKIVATQVLDATGAYDFDTFIQPNSTYKVMITMNDCIVGNQASPANLPTDWYYEGEISDPTTSPITLDTVVNGLIIVNTANVDVPGLDFALNKRPTASGYIRPNELNPGGSTQVSFEASGSALMSDFIRDSEEGTPSRIKITQAAPVSSGTIYYAGTAISVGDIIDNPILANFKIDPANADVTLGFKYVSMDSSCRESNEALFTASFVVPQISGTLHLDTVRNNIVDGNTTPNSCDDTTQLYANLIDSNTKIVLSSMALGTDGEYSFKYDDGVRPNSSYEIELSQTGASNGDAVPSASLPSGCMYADGENINSVNPIGTDGNPDGKIAVSVGDKDVVQVDFSITPSVKIGNRVWIEDDNDGDATTGNIKPVVGTTVTATCATGTFTGVTNASGIYTIEVPTHSIYTVSVPTPVGKIPSIGSNDSDITDTTSENDKTHNGKGTTVTVDTSDNLTVDFGFASVGSLSGKVEERLPNGSKKPMAGVKLTLKNASGKVVGTTVTDAQGNYSFVNLVPGAYIVIETQPANYSDVSENEGGADNDKPNNGVTNAISAVVGVGENDIRNDFVEKLTTGSLSGKVEERLPNGSKKPMAGVKLTLKNASGKVVGTTVTDAQGNYSFVNLVPGAYIVIETQPANYSDVSENEGGADNDKPNNRVTNAISAVVGVGENDIRNDFVEELYVGAIAGNVSERNLQGQLKPIANVILVLYSAGGTEIARTTTDANGNYRFYAPPGNYYIQQAQPNGYYNVSENEGGADNESTNALLNTINVIVGNGETDIGNDFVESKTKEGCGCAPTPVIPCGKCTSGYDKAHTLNLKDNSTELEWIDSYHEIAYDIYLNGRFIATVDKDVTRYTLTGLQSGVEYTVVIVANNGYGGKAEQTITFKTTNSLGWLPAIYNILN